MVSPKQVAGIAMAGTGAAIYVDFLTGYAGSEWVSLPRWDEYLNFGSIPVDLTMWTIICGLLVVIGAWLFLS